MPSRLTSRLNRFVAVLLALAAAPAHAGPARTPRQLIDGLGVEIRRSLENPEPGKTPEDAERAAAEQITALVRRSPGDDALIDADEQGRTPLMLAVAGGYAQVVKALLADPIVQVRINAADKAGETAWMIANFAPAMTLMACHPGVLTLERYALLPPYLRRVSMLRKDANAAVTSIVRALEAAGARVDPAAAVQAWLARCPHAEPELRRDIANGGMLPTLIQTAIRRQLDFNKAYGEGSTTLPQKPVEGMEFIPRPAERAMPTAGKDVKCLRRPPPVLRGTLNWSGRMLFRARVVTRAGVVEGADLQLLSPRDASPAAVDYFRGVLIHSLAGYQCEGDHVFEQEFQFKVE